MSSFSPNGESMMCATMRHLIEDELHRAKQAEELVISQKNISTKLDEQRELIQNAVDYTEDFIRQVIQHNLKPINCAELIALLTDRFGFSIRLPAGGYSIAQKRIATYTRYPL